MHRLSWRRPSHLQQRDCGSKCGQDKARVGSSSSYLRKPGIDRRAESGCFLASGTNFGSAANCVHVRRSELLSGRVRHVYGWRRLPGHQCGGEQYRYCSEQPEGVFTGFLQRSFLGQRYGQQQFRRALRQPGMKSTSAAPLYGATLCTDNDLYNGSAVWVFTPMNAASSAAVSSNQSIWGAHPFGGEQ